MSFLSKTALGLLAAAGMMAFTTPQAEARHYVRVYHGYHNYGYYHHPRVIVRSYDPYYYDSYAYGYPAYGYGYPGYYGYGGPSFSFAFGGHSHHGWDHHYSGHHHH